MATLINGKWVYDQNDKFDVMTGKPLGQVAGASTDPLQYGASGRGEFTENDANNKQVLENSNQNLPTSYKADTPFLYNDNNSGSGFRATSVPTFSADESKGFAAKSGFSGMGKDSQFAGLTSAQATAKAAELKKALLANTSANTSYAYNPQTISGFGKKVGDLKIQLDSLNSSPWDNSNQKRENGQMILNGYTNQLAGLFSSQEDFKSALNNPDLQGALQKFQSLGGNTADIAAKISEAPAGSQEATNTPPEKSTDQSMTQYLGDTSGVDAQKALKDLIPEDSLVQQQIAFQNSIPEKYKDLYFGTPEKVGILQEKIDIEKEKVELLKKKVETDKANVNAQVQYNIEKNNSDVAIEQATIEQNRLQAKNYMTGALAKLGALNTTGAAPVALATLEQKYQQQSQTLNTKLRFANQQLNIDLNEKVSGIDYKRDDDILSLKSDLSKSKEDVYKEIFKLQNAADKEKFSLISKFQDEFTKRKDTYSKEAKQLAEDNLKEQKRLMEKYDTAGFLKEFGGGIIDKRKKAGDGSGPGSPALTFANFVAGKQKEQQRSLSDGGVKSITPEYLSSLLDSNVSSDLKAVISGEKSLSTYTPSVQTKVQREMTKLGIKKEMLSTLNNKPSEVDALKEAKQFMKDNPDVEIGDIKQRFLENYPDKASLFKEYFPQ